MNQDVSEFDAKILAYHRRGLRPANIAGHLHLRAVDIRDRLIALGEYVDGNPSALNAQVSIWEMDEDRRREAIRERAAKGAREALRA